MSQLHVTAAIVGPGDEAAFSATLDHLHAQEGVALDILVVGPDAPPPAAASRHIECESSEAYERAVVEARTELITFLRPGDRPLQRAIARMAGELAADQDVVLAHAWEFCIDERGRVRKLDLRNQTATLGRIAPAGIDHRRALRGPGPVIRALPTYRRSALCAIGGFATSSGPIHDNTARRLLDHGRIVLVAEMLAGSPTAAVPSVERPKAFVRLRRRIATAQRALRRARRAGPIAVMTRLGAGPAYERLAGLLRRWPVGRATTRRQAGQQRIAYVLWHYPILSETFIRRELHALRALGHDIIVVADAPESVEPDTAVPLGDVVYLEPHDQRRMRSTLRFLLRRHPGRLLDRAIFIASRQYGPRKVLGEDIRMLRDAVHLAGVLRERGVTHVHAPWADRHAFLAVVAARLVGASFSLNLRAHEVYSSRFAFAIAEKIAAARFAVTNSLYNRSHLIAVAGPVARERVHVIYNGVDLERFPPDARRRQPGPVPRLLAVGRLVQQKGFDRLLEACALLRERGVGFECDIIGGSTPAEESTLVRLRMQYRRLGLEDCVRFLGPLPLSKVLDAYTQADVFVLPCVVTPDGGRDVTPNALLEAMAMGLPVVSTPVGAISEIVDNGVNGLLVPPMDARALAAAVERLLRDADLREGLGAAARAKIEERFDISRNAQRYAELFRNSVR